MVVVIMNMLWTAHKRRFSLKMAPYHVLNSKLNDAILAECHVKSRVNIKAGTVVSVNIEDAATILQPRDCLKNTLQFEC
jgi:hypothetical protein